MRLMLDTSAVSFQVTRAAEARKDFGKDVQKVDRESGRPQWVVEVLAQDGQVSLTDLIYPPATATGVAAYAVGGTAKAVDIKVTPIRP